VNGIALIIKLKINRIFAEECLRIYILPLLLIASIFHKTYLSSWIPVNVFQRVSIGDFCVLVIAIVYAVFARKRLVKLVLQNPKTTIIGWLFILLSLIVLLVHHDLNKHSLILLFSCALFFLLILIFIDSELKSRTLTLVACYLIFINIIGLLEYLHPDLIDGFLFSIRTQDVLVINRYERISSVMTNPNPFGVFNALMFIIIISIQYGYKKLMNIYLFICVLSFCILGVILSGSNNALMLLSAGLALAFFMILARNKRNLKWLLVSFFLIAAVVVFSMKMSPSFSTSIGRVFPVANKIYNGQHIELNDFFPNKYFSDRDIIWKEGFYQFKESPVLGIGANQFLVKNRIAPNEYNMHNIFGEILVNHGIIGFALFSVLLLIWFTNIRSFWQAAIALATVFSHMIDCFITYNLPWIIIVAWIIALTTRDFKKSNGVMMSTR
jgi:O-antigen ligase